MRHLRNEDENDLYQVLSDPEVMRFYPLPLNRVETRKWIKRAHQNYQDAYHGFYACIAKDSQDFVGICGLIPPSSHERTDKVEIGILLKRPFWTQGLATEAIDGLLDFGFSHFQFDCLIAVIDPANHGSIRVAKKNGLIFESQIKRFNKTMYVYMIKKQSWKKRAIQELGEAQNKKPCSFSLNSLCN